MAAQGADAEPFVRQFALTQGRVADDSELSLDALVRSTAAGREAAPTLPPEHADVIRMCEQPMAIAEVASRLSVYLSVTRVLVADLAELGFVAIQTARELSTRPDARTLRELIDDLQSL